MARIILFLGILSTLFLPVACVGGGAQPTSAPPTVISIATSAPAPTSAPAVQPTIKPTSLPTVVMIITTSTPGVHLTPVPTPNPQAVVQGTLQGLTSGKMLFNPPAEMDQGEPARIELRITRNQGDDLSGGLQGKGTPQISSVKVSSSMSAHLSGDDFQIDSLNSEEQLIGGDTFTQWAWDVTPLGTGKHTLHLRVTARVSVDGTEGQKDLPVVERDVNIRVNPGYLIGSFLKGYWEWVVTAILVPLVGIGWKVQADRKAKKA